MPPAPAKRMMRKRPARSSPAWRPCDGSAGCGYMARSMRDQYTGDSWKCIHEEVQILDLGHRARQELRVVRADRSEIPTGIGWVLGRGREALRRARRFGLH